MINAFFVALGATLGVVAGFGLIAAGWAALVIAYNLIVWGKPH